MHYLGFISFRHYDQTDANFVPKNNFIAIFDFVTALRTQTQTKKNFESVALQHFQNFSCGSLDR